MGLPKWMRRLRERLGGVRIRDRHERAQRPPETDEPPPAGAGVRSPLIPRTPILSGSNARAIPPLD